MSAERLRFFALLVDDDIKARTARFVLVPQGLASPRSACDPGREAFVVPILEYGSAYLLLRRPPVTACVPMADGGPAGLGTLLQPNQRSP